MIILKRSLKNSLIFFAAIGVMFTGVTSLFSAPAQAPESGARVEGIHTEIFPRGPALSESSTTPLQTADLNLKNVTAKSYLVYDQASNLVLAEQSADSPVAIASLTKLLTALVVYEHTDLYETVTITDKDVFTIRPVLGLITGDQVKYFDLFNAMIVGSANDAALTLANHVSSTTGRPFADLMNQRASELGMSDSHFSNALGFDSEQNYATAHDLQKLLVAVQDHAAFALLGRKTSYHFTSENNKAFSILATNRLLTGDTEVQAIKTGFTNEAQGAMITQINHDSHSFVIIVLQSVNREQDTLRLKEAILKSFSWPSENSH